MTAKLTPLRRLAHLGLDSRLIICRVILAQTVADGDLEDLLQALPKRVVSALCRIGSSTSLMMWSVVISSMRILCSGLQCRSIWCLSLLREDLCVRLFS